MGKKGQKRKTYSPEFKISVVMDMRENHLCYKETMREYFPDLCVSSYRFVQQWERIFLEEGAEGLMKERHGAELVKQAEHEKVDRLNLIKKLKRI